MLEIQGRYWYVALLQDDCKIRIFLFPILRLVISGGPAVIEQYSLDR